MMPLCKFWQDRAGSSAAEFALLVPVFCALTIGAIDLCLLVYGNSLMQFAVDDAARCQSVKTTVCTSTTATQNRAKATFGFPSLSPSFTVTQEACGSQVVGNVTFHIMAVVATLNVPVSASSCFPIQD